MIITCIKCRQDFDDEWRDINCPHRPFRANDGNNTFYFKMDSTGPQFEYKWFLIYDISRDMYMALPVDAKALEAHGQTPDPRVALELPQELGDKLNMRGGVDCGPHRDLQGALEYVKQQLERPQ